MLRTFASIVVVFGLCIGLAMAETVKGRITKVDGTKITMMVGANKEEKGTEKTFDAAANVKVNKIAGKDGEKMAVADGLGAAELKNIDAAKGVSASMEVNDGKVTEITIRTKKNKTN